MEHTVLNFQPGVQLVVASGQTGVWLNGVTKMAGSSGQEKILRALSAGRQSLEALQHLLDEQDEAASALTLAAFILDFEKYLES